MEQPTHRTLLTATIVTGLIIILILIVPRATNRYAYNTGSLGLSASATPYDSYSGTTYQTGQTHFGNGSSTTSYVAPTVYLGSQPTSSYYSYTTTSYPQSYQQYPTYDYGNDYNYNQYPNSNSNYNPNYPGGCNPGYTYSITTGQLCRGTY